MNKKNYLILITLLMILSSCTFYSFPENRTIPDESYVVMYRQFDGTYFFVVANDKPYNTSREAIYAFDNYTRAQEEALKNSPAWIFRIYSKTVSPPFPKTVIEPIDWEESK